MAIRNTNFKVKNHREHESGDRKGGCLSELRTRPRSQDGIRDLFGGLMRIAAYRKCFTRGSSAHFHLVRDDKAEILHGRWSMKENTGGLGGSGQ